MDLVALNVSLLAHTDHRLRLHESAEGYAQAVQEGTRILGVSVSGMEVSDTSAQISIRLTAQPELLVVWTPSAGWYLNTEDGDRVYRVTSEADAAGVVPAPATVAAWLQVIEAGDRSGHAQSPEARRRGSHVAGTAEHPWSR